MIMLNVFIWNFMSLWIKVTFYLCLNWGFSKIKISILLLLLLLLLLLVWRDCVEYEYFTRWMNWSIVEIMINEWLFHPCIDWLIYTQFGDYSIPKYQCRHEKIAIEWSQINIEIARAAKSLDRIGNESLLWQAAGAESSLDLMETYLDSSYSCCISKTFQC